MILPRLSKHFNYNRLNQRGKVLAEYIWIDKSGLQTRSKVRTLQSVPSHPEDIPEWSYDGSSTGQAPTESSEVIITPRSFYPDPFRGGDNILVMCDTHIWADQGHQDLTPADTNFRHYAAEIHEQVKHHDIWFALEQEYTLFEGTHEHGRWPLGWPVGGYPAPQGKYYCGVGHGKAVGRTIMEAHVAACLHAGLEISGTNAEVMPGQWEYQVGPANIIECGDHSWVARFILERVCEDFEVMVDLAPKPIEGDWNGAGCHINFSTKKMRDDGGIAHIHSAIEKLGKAHEAHIEVYGEGNEKRLTGLHETAPITEFRWGVADRGCSIRIPYQTAADGKGFLEDRRPASNVDPYIGCGAIAATTLLNDSGKLFGELRQHVKDWQNEKF